jgi:hypothetical protein
MLILLPPSEGKAPGGEMPDVGDPKQMEETRGVLDYATRLKGSDRRRFYGAKNDDKAREAHALNAEAMSAPCLPALERYTGVVYQYLDYASLSNKRAACARIHIVSGLFGLIAGGARIPRYKMPINAWLARYWREINAERLAGARGRKMVLSLLPQSYAKALAADELIQVNFLVQGGAKSAGHFGKAIKGKFVRYLVANKVTNPKDFSGFREDGFQFDGENFVQE